MSNNSFFNLNPKKTYINNIENDLSTLKNKELISKEYKEAIESLTFELNFMSLVKRTSPPLAVLENSKDLTNAFILKPLIQMERVIQLNSESSTHGIDQNNVYSSYITCSDDFIEVQVAYESTAFLPLNGVELKLFEKGVGLFSSDKEIDSGTTDEEGKYTFEGLAKGKQYRVHIFNPNLKQHNQLLFESYDEIQEDWYKTLNAEWVIQKVAIDNFSAFDALKVYIDIQKGILEGATKFIWDAVKLSILVNPVAQVNLAIADLATINNNTLNEYVNEFRFNIDDLNPVKIKNAIDENIEAAKEAYVFLSDEAMTFITFNCGMTLAKILALSTDDDGKTYPYAKTIGNIVSEIIISSILAAAVAPFLTPAASAALFVARIAKFATKIPVKFAKKIFDIISSKLNKIINKTGRANIAQSSAGTSLVKNKRNNLTQDKTGYIANKNQHDNNHNESGKDPNGKPNNRESETRKEGEPISLVTGEELLSLFDAKLLNFTPFDFKRLYRSSAVEIESPFGFGWSHVLFYDITFTKNEIIWRDHENLTRSIPLPTENFPEGSNQLGGNVAYLGRNKNEYIISSSSLNGFYAIIERKDRQGIITKLTDRDGNSFNLLYRQDGLIARIENPNTLESLFFSYETLSIDQEPSTEETSTDHSAKKIRLTEITLQKRVIDREALTADYHNIATMMQYRYDKNGQLHEAENSLGQIDRYWYRDDHVIKKRRMAGGAEFYWVWEGEGKEAHAIEQTGNMEHYHLKLNWNDEDGSVYVTHYDGSVERYKHDQSTALLLEKMDPDRAITRYEYDQNGHCTKEIDPLGNETIYDYDTDGNLDAILTPSLTYRYRYDLSGNVIESRIHDEEYSINQKDQYCYNEAGKCIEAINTLGESTHYQWNEAGLLASVHYADGRSEEYHYNDRGLLSEKRLPNGLTLHYRYDALGFISAIQEGEHVTHYRHDTLGNLLNITFPNGTSRQYSYNAYQKVTSFTDEAGQVTHYEYAAPLHLLTKVTKPDGSIVQYRYDNAKNFVSQIINEVGDHYHIDYYPNGLIKEERTFDGRLFQYEYDLNGHLIKQTELGHDHHPDSALITLYERDAAGNLIKKSLPNGSDIHYHYDALGRLLSADDGKHPLGYEYDPLGRLIAEHQNYASTYYHYNELGELATMILPDKNEISYHYNAGMITAIDLNGERLIDHQYDQYYREVSRRYADQTTLFEYDEQHRLRRQQIEQQSHQHQRQLCEYHYDSLGNLTQIDDSLMGRKEYRYDQNQRLIQALHSAPFSDDDGLTPTLPFDPKTNQEYGESFHHDRAGNVLGANVDPHEVEIQHNCLLKEGNLHYRYDAFGRLIETEHHSSLDPQKRTPLMSYRYDDQHQLCKIINHETGEKYRYAYDLFGRRIEKENLNTGDLTKFLWQGDHLLAEYQDDQLLMPDADVKPTEYRTYLYEMGSFAPLALLEGKSSHTTPYFYINDHLGTPQQVVNQTGQTVWTALYYAYGEIETGLINEIKQPLRFQGQYADNETGLHYNRHRYYNPKTARFITFDPIGLAGGLNNTQYVPNPTGWIDPLGFLRMGFLRIKVLIFMLVLMVQKQHCLELDIDI